MEKNNTIQSAEIQSGVHSVILAKDVIPDGQMKVDMAMHAEMDMQDTTDLKYLAQIASSILGQDSYSQVFYTDGYYYVDTNGVKLKYPMPLEQIHILRPDRSHHQQYGIQLYEGHFLKRGQWKTCAGI